MPTPFEQTEAPKVTDHSPENSRLFHESVNPGGKYDYKALNNVDSSNNPAVELLPNVGFVDGSVNDGNQSPDDSALENSNPQNGESESLDGGTNSDAQAETGAGQSDVSEGELDSQNDSIDEQNEANAEGNTSFQQLSDNVTMYTSESGTTFIETDYDNGYTSTVTKPGENGYSKTTINSWNDSEATMNSVGTRDQDNYQLTAYPNGSFHANLSDGRVLSESSDDDGDYAGTMTGGEQAEENYIYSFSEEDNTLQMMFMNGSSASIQFDEDGRRQSGTFQTPGQSEFEVQYDNMSDSLGSASEEQKDYFFNVNDSLHELRKYQQDSDFLSVDAFPNS